MLQGLRPHEKSGVLGFSQRCTDYGTPDDLANETPMIASVGDVIAHSSLVLHRAGRNTTSDRERRAIGFVYFGVSAKADEAAIAAHLHRLRESLALAGKA